MTNLRGKPDRRRVLDAIEFEGATPLPWWLKAILAACAVVLLLILGFTIGSLGR
jgi:hypothetical protein